LFQPQLITKYGYDAETHTVLTADGYFLTLHRIPRGHHGETGHKGCVFVQHGLLSSSADWVILGPDKALGKPKYGSRIFHHRLNIIF
jgi:lysosomal acid lipase/cholesteryl ester hydrolase